MESSTHFVYPHDELTEGTDGTRTEQQPIGHLDLVVVVGRPTGTLSRLPFKEEDNDAAEADPRIATSLLTLREAPPRRSAGRLVRRYQSVKERSAHQQISRRRMQPAVVVLTDSLLRPRSDDLSSNCG